MKPSEDPWAEMDLFSKRYLRWRISTSHYVDSLIFDIKTTNSGLFTGRIMSTDVSGLAEYQSNIKSNEAKFGLEYISGYLRYSTGQSTGKITVCYKAEIKYKWIAIT